MSLAIVCCMHGTEPYGLEVAKKLPSLHFFIANKKALKLKKRFIDVDLNRCFPGSKNGSHEEKIAHSLLKKIKSFNYLIDLHSSSNNCPLFGIITKANKEKITFAKKLNLKRLVIMSENFASGKALIDFVKCGISLEIGPHNGEKNVPEVLNSIYNFLGKKQANEKLEIFEVFSIIKQKAPNILIKNFEYIKKGQLIASDENNKQYSSFDFISVLVGEEAYKDILCLACRKI